MGTLSLLVSDLSLAHVAMLVAILAASAVMSGLSGFGFSAIGALSLFVLPPLLAVRLPGATARCWLLGPEAAVQHWLSESGLGAASAESISRAEAGAADNACTAPIPS